MDSETRDILDGNAELGLDGYETAANAELGELVTRGGPLNPDATTFADETDYTDCRIGACAAPTGPPKGKRPEMTFWDVRGLIDKALSRGVPLKVTARTCTLIDKALRAAEKHSLVTQHAMSVRFHYESLPGRLGNVVDVVLVDDLDEANVRRFVGSVDWQLKDDQATDTTAEQEITTGLCPRGCPYMECYCPDGSEPRSCGHGPGGTCDQGHCYACDACHCGGEW